MGLPGTRATQHELHRRSEGPRYRWTLQWKVGGDQHVGLSAAGGDRGAAGDAGECALVPPARSHPDRAGTDGNTLRRTRELVRPRDLVRPGVDARHGAGRDIGGPHIPGSEGDLGHTEADGDRSLDGAVPGSIRQITPLVGSVAQMEPAPTAMPTRSGV